MGFSQITLTVKLTGQNSLIISYQLFSLLYLSASRQPRITRPLRKGSITKLKPKTYKNGKETH